MELGRATYLVPPGWDVDTPRLSGGIGGSQAAIVLGLSKWGDPATLWAEKRGLIEPEPWVPDVHSLPYWGNVMEPVLLREYAMDVGMEVVGRWWDGAVVRFMPDGTVARYKDDPLAKYLNGVRHPEHPYMIGHIDGLVVEKDRETIVAVVDAKTSNYFVASDWGDEDTDQVPDDYLCQVTHYQEIFRAILGREVFGHVAMLLGGMTWRKYDIPFHQPLADLLVDAEGQFWASLDDEDGMPPIPRTKEGQALLSRLYPRQTEPEKTVDITHLNDWLEVGDKLNEVRLEEKELKALRTQLEVEFKERMADAAEVTTDARPWSAAWRAGKDRKSVAYDAVISALAERHDIPEEEVSALLEENTETKPGSRRFTFKYVREESE